MLFCILTDYKAKIKLKQGARKQQNIYLQGKVKKKEIPTLKEKLIKSGEGGVLPFTEI